MSEVRGYKVFNPDWTCDPEGVVKQYTCPGKFETGNGAVICEHGMHFCLKLADCFNYYPFKPENKVAEVVAYGEVAYKNDDSKACTDKLQIVRELTWYEVLELVNMGKGCTGLCNTGNRNTGDYNAGDCNTGDYNAGDRNTGNCNTGYRNTGNCNTGDYNAGNRNIGDYNAGDWNIGDYNAGDYNAGNCNTGDYNAGNRNIGDYNAGDWNTTNFSSGCFNTEEQKIMLFNKPSDWSYRDWLGSNVRWLLNDINKVIVEWINESEMTDEEKEANPEYKTTGGYLKVHDESECAQSWWDDLTEHNKEIIRSIPNFDAEIFKECTRIDVNK